MEQKGSGLNTVGTEAPFFDGSQVCRQIDPELFFPEDKGEARENLKVVRPICDKCEFKMPCLEYALDNAELQGIWGGVTEWDRKRMKKMKRRVA